jgi:hypothetical protein
MESLAVKAFSSRPRWSAAWMFLSTALASTSLAAEPTVEFDFARLIPFRVVEVAESASSLSDGEKLVEVVIPISVRFRGVPVDDVRELDFEVDASDAELRVAGFAPATQLHTDITQPIYTSTTKENARALEATLGGELPVPMGDVVSHVTPSVTAAVGKSESATERLSRLPPKEAIVVSGTASQGQGVFYKLKRSTQTSLEGVHEISIQFVVPEDWQGCALRVTCTARGQRTVFWMDKPAQFGQVAARVQLYEAGDAEMRDLARRRESRAQRQPRRPSLFEAATAAFCGSQL